MSSLGAALARYHPPGLASRRALLLPRLQGRSPPGAPSTLGIRRCRRRRRRCAQSAEVVDVVSDSDTDDSEDMSGSEADEPSWISWFCR